MFNPMESLSKYYSNSKPFDVGSYLQQLNTLPNGGGTYSVGGAAGGQSNTTSGLWQGPVQPPVVEQPPVVQTPAPIFNQQAPTQTTTTAPAPPVRSKYMNPATGKYYTPQEYANSVAMKIPAGKATGDIGQYAGDAKMDPNQSAQDLTTRMTNMNNTRNDIATGTTDPYQVGNKSGIAYSPQELKAIENAYAGIYDPALNDVFARLEEKKATDKEALTRKNMLEEKAIEHGYRMEEKEAEGGGLSGPSSYQEWTLAGGEAGTGQTYAAYLKGDPVGESYKSQIAGSGLQIVDNLLEIGEANPGIFGWTASTPMPDWLRTEAYRNYNAQLDSLRGNIIPAALTAMREASSTGGALGQVSDREGQWLGASLGALDMSQSPEQAIASLREIEAHLKTWEDAVAKYGGGNNPDTMELKTEDGKIETFALQPDGGYKKVIK